MLIKKCNNWKNVKKQKGLMYVEAEISTGEDGVERLIDTLSLIGK